MKKQTQKKKKPQKKKPSKAVRKIVRKQWTELYEGYERHMSDPNS